MKLQLVHEREVPTGVLGMALAPEGLRVHAACADGSVRVIDAVLGEEEVLDVRHGSFASGCVLLPDGRTLISGGYDGRLIWHDLPRRHGWRESQVHRFWSWQLALSPDGARVATVTGQYLPGSWDYEPAAGDEPTVVVLDTRSGERLASYSHLPPVLSCAFCPDNRHLAVANMMGEISVWDVQQKGTSPVVGWRSPDFTSWGRIKSHHHCGGIYGLAFSPDGKALLACGMGPMTDPMAGNGRMTWQRWDWQKGELVDQIRDGEHGSGLMESVAWAPDGRHFVMAGRMAQGTWNVGVFASTDGSLVGSLNTHQRVTHARFTSDGRHLVLAGARSQPAPKEGQWPAWGRIHVYAVEPG